jgi:outer membrane protein OmpA-like peptidoglycan-associated protein
MMRRAIPALASLVLLAGCPRQALFVVLPNAEGGGSVGAITVEDGKAATTLDQPYATAESRSGSTAPVEETQGNISVIFRSAIAARPVLPHHFRLYFTLGSDELTPESRAAYRAVFDDTKQRPVYEIEVIGFTDTLGGLRYNQALSLRRAGAIRDTLIRDGLDPRAISIAGRGKHDLLVPTADQTQEPRNRRVEITVR